MRSHSGHQAGVEDDHTLARRASRYLSTDDVRPAQAAVYRELLTSGPTGDPLTDFAPGLSRAAVISFAAGDLRYDKLPDDVRDRLRQLERRMSVASHRWPKGLLATALALTE